MLREAVRARYRRVRPGGHDRASRERTRRYYPAVRQRTVPSRRAQTLIRTSKVRTHRWLSAIDIFAGCGGLTLGLKQAGFRVIGAVEIDRLAAETYRANHPAVRLWESDIRKLAARDVAAALRLRPGRLDLLAGCPPCQGFSALRSKNGGRIRRHPGNFLLDDFARFVRSFRPKAVMMENVPGMKGHRRLRRLLRTLNLLGYVGECRILDAADFGVPQRRRRLVLLAGRRGAVPFAAPTGPNATVRDAIGGLPPPGASGDELHDLLETRSEKVKRLIRRIPKNGGSRVALGEALQLTCHRKCDGFSDIYGRMAWNGVAPTITGGCINPSKGRFLHPSQNRAITLREAALLQSFPWSYNFKLNRGKYAAAWLIGNALPPEFSRQQALGVRAYLQYPRSVS